MTSNLISADVTITGGQQFRCELVVTQQGLLLKSLLDGVKWFEIQAVISPDNLSAFDAEWKYIEDTVELGFPTHGHGDMLTSNNIFLLNLWNDPIHETYKLYWILKKN